MCASLAVRGKLYYQFFVDWLGVQLCKLFDFSSACKPTFQLTAILANTQLTVKCKTRNLQCMHNGNVELGMQSGNRNQIIENAVKMN